MHVSSEGHNGYQFGVFTLDLDRGALLERGAVVSLRPKSFEVLCQLVSHQGTLVTREELLSAVWPDVVVTDDSLTQCLIDIRRALGDQDRSMVRTIPRRGFIFEPAIEPLQDLVATNKHPSRKVNGLYLALATVLLAAMVLWYYLESVRPPSTSSPATMVEASLSNKAIAVLDFDDMSPAQDQQWFAQGLSEEIRNLLATTPDLKVIGRSSSSASMKEGHDLRSIGQALGVRHLLEGSVRITDERVRIGVQLIDASDGAMTWSESYSGTLSELFSLQDTVAAAVLDALKLQIGVYPSRGRPTRSNEAYALLLKARLAQNIQDAVAAEADLLRAVELDPDFAEAWELLAHTHWTQPVSGLEVSETKELMRQAAGKALMVEPGREFSRAMYIEGSAQQYLTADVIDAYVLAASKQPNNPSILRALSWNLIIAGYLDEGLETARRMVDVDPLSSVAHIRYASALGASGKEEESSAALQAAHRLGPDGLDWYVGENRLSAGNIEAALAHFTTALQQMDISDTSWLADTLDKARQGVLPTDSALDELLLAGSSLSQDQVNFITTALNRWQLLTGHLDLYYRIMLDYLAEGQMSPHTEFYAWYGVLNRDRGFTAHPRYLELARLMGLIEVWEQRGPPDYCSKPEDQWVCF